MKLTKALKLFLIANMILSLLLSQVAYALPVKSNERQGNSNESKVNSGSNYDTRRYREGELILKVNGGPSEEARLLKKYGLSKIKQGPKGNYLLASVPRGGNVQEVINKLRQEKKVVFSQPNYIYKPLGLPNDSQVNRQWALNSIKAENSWNTVKPGKANTSVIVAVLDTGVDVKHPDLQNRLVSGTNTVNPLKSTRDNDGHGTHIAGIISAVTNNKLGIAGVAGNAPVKIMPVKVFEEESGSDISISDGIIWAADHGAKVINMSFGGYFKSYVLDEAIDYAYEKGVVMVAAAGNWASEEVSYPAALAKVIAVSAINKKDELTEFSSYGPLVDLCAPGEEIYSTFWDPYKGSTYTEMSGTSMASPMVAGLAALLLVKKPGLTADEVRQIMEVSATDLGDSGWDPKFGHGKINVGKALSVSLSGFNDGDNNILKAHPIKSGESIKGKIDIGSDQDWYKITVPAKGTIQFEVLPAGKVSPGVEVFNSFGKSLAAFNTGGSVGEIRGPGTGSFKVAETIHGMVTDLEAGDYYIKVFGNHFRWSDEEYSLTAEVFDESKLAKDTYEPNDQYVKARDISVGRTITGAILKQGDQDWFKARLNGRIYKLRLETPAGLDLAVSIEGANIYTDETNGFEDTYWFEQTINTGGVGKAEVATIVLPQSGGSYFIKVYETSGAAYNDNYSLTISSSEIKKDAFEPNDRWNSLSPITLGREINGNFHREEDVDWYKVSVEKTGILKINFRQPVNTWCDIELFQAPDSDSPDQTPIPYSQYWLNFGQFSDDSGKRSYDIKAYPGTYYLKVSNIDGTISDYYNLTVDFNSFDFIDAENNDDVTEAVELNLGTVNEGTLFPDGDVDVYEISVEKSQPLSLNLIPPAGIDTGVVIIKPTEYRGESGFSGLQGLMGLALGDDSDKMPVNEPAMEVVSLINNGGKGQPDTGVFVPSNSGTYYVVVAVNEGKGSGKYRLTVNPYKLQPDKWENNGTMAKAKPVLVNSVIKPTFMGIEDEDWYKIYTKEAGTLKLELTVPSDIDGVIELYNNSGKLLLRADQSMVGEKENATIYLGSPGFYYIKTYDYLGNSSVQPYSLSISHKR